MKARASRNVCFRLMSAWAIALRMLFAPLGGLLFALALSAGASEPPPISSEYHVKAGFLYNFAKFTEWPGDNETLREGGFVLCVAGDDPLGPALLAIEGKLVHGQPLRVRRGVTFGELRGCHMLFLPETEERRLPAVLRAAQAYPLLTVSDVHGFTDAGGMIGLALANSRIQFDINLAPANRAKLKISSQLLGLARSVSGRKRGD